MVPDVLSLPNFGRLSDWVGPWAIEARAGQALLTLARAPGLAVHVRETNDAPPKVRSDFSTVKAGQDQTIAVVRLQGTLMKSVSSMDNGTSTVAARRDIRNAANDPTVDGILLLIDSPGGTVSGTADLGNEVKAARDKKPVYAFVQDLGASAAYWIASQAEKVFANDRTALVGSIGTLAVVYDASALFEKEGVRTIVVGTGPLKGAAAPGSPVTAEQEEYFRAMVDDAQVSFDAAVKKGRGMTAAQLDAVKTGGVFGASEALERGLIDGIKSVESVLSELAGAARRQSRESARAAGQARRSVMNDELSTAAVAEPTAAVSTPAATVPDPVAAIRSNVSAEMDRIAGIQRVAGKHPAIAAEAVKAGWSVEKTELTALRADLERGVRPMGAGAPAGIVKSNPLANSRVFEAALCLRAGVPAVRVERDYGREIIDLAGGRDVRGVASLSTLLHLTIQSNGGGQHYGPVTDDMVRSAFEADRELKRSGGAGVGLRADTGFSTYSLSGILSNIAGKLLLASFEAVDPSILKVCAQTDVNDFKAVTRHRITANGLFEKVGPTGELKSANLSEETFNNKADTFGRITAITRQDWINDDLGAFARLTNLLGRNAMLALIRQVALRILTTANFFSAGNKNSFTGAGTALSVAALGAAVQKFMELSDANGPIMVTPAFLVVPPALSVLNGQLYSSAFVNETTTADKGKPNTNPHAGKYEPIMLPHLGANAGLKDDAGAAVTGSDTAWYLFANPADVPAVEVVYLRGQRTPTIETADTDFSTLGVLMRGYFDFGTAAQDPKGAQKQAGA
jgi:signal peptide peptidase SppA